jgi:hypothetical protein
MRATDLEKFWHAIPFFSHNQSQRTKTRMIVYGLVRMAYVYLFQSLVSTSLARTLFRLTPLDRA